MNGMPSAKAALVLPKIISVRIDDNDLSLDLEDSRTVSVPIGWYPRLSYGMPAERANFQISSAGYGVHWPDLDEDIGIEGLLLGKKSTESLASFEQWLQKRKKAKKAKAVFSQVAA